MDHSIIRLSNGIRVVFHPSASSITHTCILIGTGSRDEPLGKYGIAHLIEHLLFKKTKKRSTNQIINRIEAVGGDLNAYTTKEYTCVHVSVLQPYLDRTLDLFEDIIFSSTFPEHEIEKEKEVIVDEIASYLDSPEESIMDDFEDLLFKDSNLGHNILGSEEDLRNISRDDVLAFMKDNYNTEEIVIAITGNYKYAKVQRLVHRVFENVPPNNPLRREKEVQTLYSEHRRVSKPVHQVHYMLGAPAYSIFNKKKYDLLLLNNVLGGMGMGSTLNLSVREKYGIAYTIESNYSLYSDTGAFTIYMGTDEEKVKKATKLIYKELDKAKKIPFSSYQLERAKQKFKGQIALAEENRLGLIISEAKNLIDYGRIITLDEVFEHIDGVSSEQILEVAGEIFDERSLVSLQYIPED